MPEPYLKMDVIHKFISCVIIVILQRGFVKGHGGLIEPPMRSIAWRYGFDTPVNYDWNGLFCGGYDSFVRHGGRCGFCGDPVEGPFENDKGGVYDTGVIVRHYPVGLQEIEVKIEITAYHKGFFTFKLCPNNDGPITQECLNRYPLPIREGLAQGDALKYYPPASPKLNELHVALPPDVICDRCVLQWTYTAGNSFGTSESGRSCVGCGLQETFVNCADISIGGTKDNIPVQKGLEPGGGVVEIDDGPKTTDVLENAVPGSSIRDILQDLGLSIPRPEPLPNTPAFRPPGEQQGIIETDSPLFRPPRILQGNTAGDPLSFRPPRILPRNTDNDSDVPSVVLPESNRVAQPDTPGVVIPDTPRVTHPETARVTFPETSGVLNGQQWSNRPAPFLPPLVDGTPAARLVHPRPVSPNFLDISQPTNRFINRHDNVVGPTNQNWAHSDFEQPPRASGQIYSSGGYPSNPNQPKTNHPLLDSLRPLVNAVRNGQNPVSVSERLSYGPVNTDALMQQRERVESHLKRPQGVTDARIQDPAYQDALGYVRMPLRNAADLRRHSLTRDSHFLPINGAPRRDIYGRLVDSYNQPLQHKSTDYSSDIVKGRRFPTDYRSRGQKSGHQGFKKLDPNLLNSMSDSKNVARHETTYRTGIYGNHFKALPEIKERTRVKPEAIFASRRSILPRRIIVHSMHVAKKLLRTYPSLRGRVFLSRRAHQKNSYAQMFHKYARRRS